MYITLTVLLILLSLSLVLLAIFILKLQKELKISEKRANELNDELIKNKTELEILKNEKTNEQNMLEIIQKEFTNIANKALLEKQEDLRKLNLTSLDEKFAPLSERIKEFQKKVEEFNINGVKNTQSLITQISTLEEKNKKIEEEAHNLTKALTMNQNIKGAYGEGLLENILSSSGLIEGVHYFKQFKTESINEKGELKTIRPDFVVNLSEDKHLIVDSKFTLSSFLALQNEEVNPENAQKEFKRAISERIKELSDKNYQDAKMLDQPDFVLMYIPLENSLSMIYSDQDLINSAYKNNVIIVGTSSLLATFRLVYHLRNMEKSHESANKIVEAGCSLYETFVLFCEDLKKLQGGFDSVSNGFRTTINRFERNNPKNPSIFSSIEKLKEFGIHSQKEIPEEFLQERNELGLQI